MTDPQFLSQRTPRKKRAALQFLTRYIRIFNAKPQSSKVFAQESQAKETFLTTLRLSHLCVKAFPVNYGRAKKAFSMSSVCSVVALFLSGWPRRHSKECLR